MHIIVCWNIKPISGRQQINDQMKKTLSDFTWVRPLPYFYVIKINSEEDREIIKEKLLTLVKIMRRVNLIISPAIENGHYSGWLPRKLWPEIKKRTEVE